MVRLNDGKETKGIKQQQKSANVASVAEIRALQMTARATIKSFALKSGEEKKHTHEIYTKRVRDICVICENRMDNSSRYYACDYGSSRTWMFFMRLYGYVNVSEKTNENGYVCNTNIMYRGSEIERETLST